MQWLLQRRLLSALLLKARPVPVSYTHLAGYKGITNKQYRLSQFYKDGFASISHVLGELGYLVGINIPTRYRRHFDMLGS